MRSTVNSKPGEKLRSAAESLACRRQNTEYSCRLWMCRRKTAVRPTLVAAPPSNRLRTPADLLHSHTWPIHSAAGLGCQSLTVPDMRAGGAA